MNPVIECPYCDGHAKLEKQIKELVYRKESFKVFAHYYKCNLCSEEFTTTESDTITILQLHNQYRVKNNIPFIEEILEIRETYGLSAAKMSEVLALGINGYGNYEKGEIPTPAIGNLIYTAKNAVVFKSMLEKAKIYFSDGMFNDSILRLNYLIDKDKSYPYQLRLNQHNEPNALTGYKRMNKEKLSNILIAYINNCKSEFNDRLKLNKLLFYTDFLSYKLTGFSITGLSYRAIKYGPVPTFYDNIYACLENEEIIISNWIKDNDGSAKEHFITEQNFDANLFNEAEKSIIDSIINNFKNTSSWDLVELSHKEKAWIDLYSNKEVIDYQTYAFDIEGA